MVRPVHEDDPSITNDTELWRRVHPSQVVSDGAGGYRPSSAALDNDSDGDPMSILISTVMEEYGLAPEHALEGRTGYSLVGFTAGLARGYDQKIARSPEPEQPAHGFVVGYKPHAIRKKWAKRCHWVIAPRPA